MGLHQHHTRPQAPWHFLNFLPLPHQHGSLRPTFGSSRRTVVTAASSPPVRAGRGAALAEKGAGAVEVDPPLRVIGDGFLGAGRGTAGGGAPLPGWASMT